MTTLPQADLSWFPSQILWSLLCFLLHFILSRFLIIPSMRDRRLSRDAYLRHVEERMNITSQDIANLKSEIRQFTEYEHIEKEAIMLEVQDEARRRLADATAIQRAEEVELLNRAEDSGRAYAEQISKFAQSNGRLVNKILSKLGGFDG